MTDRLVLTLDGSTRVCSAALLRLNRGETHRPRRSCWEVVVRRSEADGRSQAKVLLRLVDEMLQEVGGGPKDVGAIVVGIGPGTFTGVRITVATARGLGLALAVPVLGVSSLGALAAAAAAILAGRAPGAGSADNARAGEVGTTKNDGTAADGVAARCLLVPAIDARRGQVFFGTYEAVAEATGAAVVAWARSADFCVCDSRAFGDVLAGHGAERTVVVAAERTLVGELPVGVDFVSAEVEAERLVIGQERLAESGVLPQGPRLTPWLLESLKTGVSTRAGGTGGPALNLAASPDAGSPGTPESVRPIYVRNPDADIHITKMKDPWSDDLHRRQD